VTRDLARGQHVDLELERLGRWAARIEAVMPERVAVASIVQLPEAASTLTGTAARMAFITPRGIMRSTGVVLGVDLSGILELALTGDLEIDQRREHVRVASRLPGLVAHPAAGHKPLLTYTLDVSGGGVLIAGAGPADVGDVVQATVKLPSADAVQAPGRIARRSREGHVALVFDAMAPQERERLVRFVFEQQRLERRAQRESG